GPTPSFGPAPKPSFGCTIAGLIFGEIGPPTFLSDFGTPAGRPTAPILLLTRGCATTRRETERCTFTRGALRTTGARLTEIVRRCAAEISVIVAASVACAGAQIANSASADTSVLYMVTPRA